MLQIKKLWFPLFLIIVLFLLGNTPVQAVEGVIIGDNVNARHLPNLNAHTYEQLFKGNRVTVKKFVDGDLVNGNKKWAEIVAPYLYQELYVHSAYVKTGKEADEFLKNFSLDETYQKLKKDFTPAQINKIKEYKKSFDTIKDLNDFVSVYKKAFDLVNELSPIIEKKYEAQLQKESNNRCNLYMAWIYNLLPGLFICYTAEGTVAQFSIVVDYFVEKAKLTKSSVDDDFIDIFKTSYGNWYFQHRPVWFQYTWDYGGQSLLGTGIHAKILQMMDKALAHDKTFSKEILAIREQLFNDIFQCRIFYETKEAIIAELNKIMKEIKLSDTEKERVQKRINELNSNKGNIQTNCKKNNCDYGG